MTTSTPPLRALALVCTLNPSPAESSSQLIADQVLAALAEHGVEGDSVRLVDHDVKPGVRGHGIDSGHHMAEEAPDDLATALTAFFRP